MVAISQAKAKRGKVKPSVTKLGQHHVKGSGCIATRLNGRPCPSPRVESHLPYCKQCLKSGDPSLRVVDHPKFGKCLIARRRLPKGYTVAWWGRRIGKKKLPEKSWNWALETDKGIIDAVPFRKGSQLQFCQCPGPSEKATIDDHPRQYSKLLASKPKTCLLFGTLCDIPKGYQLTMMYNYDDKSTEEFFQERGIVRQDVGCKQFPALKKMRSTKAKAKAKGSSSSSNNKQAPSPKKSVGGDTTTAAPAAPLPESSSTSIGGAAPEEEKNFRQEAIHDVRE